MFDPWQDILVSAVVVAAIGYLTWRAWRTVSARNKSGCGGCSRGTDVHANDTNDRSPVAKPFVALESLETSSNGSEPDQDGPTP